MKFEQIVPAIFLLAILILVIPEFLRSNAKLKLFLKNTFIWSIIVSIVVIVSYLIYR